MGAIKAATFGTESQLAGSKSSSSSAKVEPKDEVKTEPEFERSRSLQSALGLLPAAFKDGSSCAGSRAGSVMRESRADSELPQQDRKRKAETKDEKKKRKAEKKLKK